MPPTHTQACEDRDFVEWHRGCAWCAVWVLRVETPQIARSVQQARERLIPWLLPRYARQPHITLAYRGLMEEECPHPAAEFGVTQLQADVRALQRARLSPFVVHVQGGGSFSTVPYLRVAPHPQLQRAHAVLGHTTPGSDPDWRYVPHVTLGHYRCQVPLVDVMSALHAAGAAIAGRADVPALWLARYRTHDIAGALHWEGCFELRTQQYHPQPDALWAEQVRA